MVTRSLYSSLSFKLMRANARFLLARITETRGDHDRILNDAALHLAATADTSFSPFTVYPDAATGSSAAPLLPTPAGTTSPATPHPHRQGTIHQAACTVTGVPVGPLVAAQMGAVAPAACDIRLRSLAVVISS